MPSQHGSLAHASADASRKNGTRLHAATLDENWAVALHLSAGQAHDGRQFETLYESLDPDNVLEFAALDRGYDADRIRDRLARDGIEAVIPPISTRCQKPRYDKELYRGRKRTLTSSTNSAALPPATTSWPRPSSLHSTSSPHSSSPRINS